MLFLASEKTWGEEPNDSGVGHPLGQLSMQGDASQHRRTGGRVTRVNSRTPVLATSILPPLFDKTLEDAS